VAGQPVDDHAEAALLGCVLFVGSLIGRLTIDHGLTADDFARARHQHIFRAAVAVADQGKPVDLVTVAAELDERGLITHDHVDTAGKVPRYVLTSLNDQVPDAHNWKAYLETVLELAEWRRIQGAASTILEGVELRDRVKVQEGEVMLGRRGDVEKRTYSPEELASEAFDAMQDDGGEKFPWPWAGLNKRSAMRRGQLTLVAGWSSHGKSVVMDQTLETAIGKGLSAHLYINEMTRVERTHRTLARLAEVDLTKIEFGTTNDDENRRLVEAMGRIPFGITDCAGWTAQDVARDVRRHGYDVVAVDIVNRFPGGNDREQLEEISRVLNELTKPSQANCHLLLGAHLNRNRLAGGMTLPFPTPPDLRTSSMLYNDADNCMFVHREQDADTGDPTSDGMIRFAKVRQGRPGGLEVTFQGHFQRFVPARQLGTVTA
jgi:replicative DNA helicase